MMMEAVTVTVLAAGGRADRGRVADAVSDPFDPQYRRADVKTNVTSVQTGSPTHLCITHACMHAAEMKLKGWICLSIELFCFCSQSRFTLNWFV